MRYFGAEAGFELDGQDPLLSKASEMGMKWREVMIT